MSVEEIRAQRRELHDPEEDDYHGHTKEVQMSEDGSIHVEKAVSSDGETEPKDTTDPSSAEVEKTSSDVAPHPPVGSLADLALSPPGSPVPSSPTISAEPAGRIKSPLPPTGPARPATHSRSNEAYLQTVLKRRASNSADDFAEKMRTAAVMLAQLSQQQNSQPVSVGANGAARTSSRVKTKAASVEEIRAKIIREMTALEEQRMQRMKLEGVSSGVGGGGGEGAGSEMLEDERKVMANVATDDPSGKGVVYMI